MMKTRRLVLALLALVVSWTLVVPATRSQEQEEFIIDGADAVATRATGISLPLPIPLESRFILEWADTTNEVQVGAVPPAMPLVLDPRFILEWADALVIRGVECVPAAMPQTLQPRYILERADASRQFHLAYPCELIGDETAPSISLSAPEVEADSATVTWQTDELADSLLEYGQAPGSYSETVYGPGYAKLHMFTLSGLLLDTTYYCRVTSTDRCGNAASTTSGCQFTTTSTTTSYIYLPLVLRAH
jgi:hypothetical protein